jgi:DNA-binding CsgD family transcriptional regulator
MLGAALDAALAGSGGLVLVGGAAGIGKTTMVAAVAREATERGALVLTGRCYDLSETPPYGPWWEVLRRYPADDPDLPPLPPALSSPVREGVAARTRDLPFDATMETFLVAVAASRPLMLVLDDLHWADPASLDVLRRLARVAASHPMLIVGTYRTEEIEPRQPLHAILPALIREANPARVVLRPLGDDDVRAIIGVRYALDAGDLDRLVAYLQARAEGNPFFIGELLQTLEDEEVLRRLPPDADGGERGPRWVLGEPASLGLPPLLRQVLERRLARLSEDDRGLLVIAAIIGQEVPLALWAAVSLADEERLIAVVEEGVAAHLLETDAHGVSIRFAHALVREALYEGLVPPRRRIWHRRVAEALAGSAEGDPDAVAFHFRQAGDARAVAWLLRAGERAQQSYAWVTAADRYEAALALSDGPDADPGARAMLLAILAQLRRYSAPEQGIAHLEEAERLARAAGDDLLAAGAHFDRGHLRCMARDYARGLAEMTEGLAALDDLPLDGRSRLPVMTVLGIAPEEHAHYHRGVLVLFLAVVGRFDDALSIAAPPDTPTPGITARELLGRAWGHAARGEPDRARDALAAARATYGEQHWEVGTTLFYELDLVVLPYETDRLAERQRLADEAVRAWTRASGALAGLSPQLARLPLLALEGRWDKASDLARATLAASEGSAAWRRSPTRFLAFLAHARGEHDLAWQLVNEEFPDGPATAPGAKWFLHAVALQRLAAALAIDGGDLATARAWLDAHDRWLAWSGAVLGQAEGHLGWAAYHRAAGDFARARRCASDARAAAAALRQPLALLAAHRLLGELATHDGDLAIAKAHLDAALALADACAAPYERALTLLARAELRRASGDRNGVAHLVEEIRTICTPLGARPALARAEALAPAPPRTPQGGYPGGLTAREGEVLVLIAQGRSNQEIADALWLSVRTVERHINKLYAKIDARSRADAVAYAARHGLLSA